MTGPTHGLSRPATADDSEPRHQVASVVDLFCGVGGLTHGFVQEGFRVVAGVDLDHTCKFAYEANNRAAFIHKAVEELTASELLEMYPSGDQLVALTFKERVTYQLLP